MPNSKTVSILETVLYALVKNFVRIKEVESSKRCFGGEIWQIKVNAGSDDNSVERGTAKRDQTMIRTIKIGKYITAQGVFVRALGNGHIVIRAGKQTLTGRPISARVA